MSGDDETFESQSVDLADAIGSYLHDWEDQISPRSYDVLHWAMERLRMLGRPS